MSTLFAQSTPPLPSHNFHPPLPRTTPPMRHTPLRPALGPHRTSSLRDPMPNATPPGGSPNGLHDAESDADGDDDEEYDDDDDDMEEDVVIARPPIGKTRGRPLGVSVPSTISRGKRGAPRDRRRTTRTLTRPSNGGEMLISPAKTQYSGDGMESPPDSGHYRSHPGGRSGGRFTASHNGAGGPPGGLAPIKPIGFAAGRESRKEDGGMVLIPSPVVMGFDFKKIDEDQLKTVRDTLSIKEQQQALIALRRREVAASTPNTPKEMTFKGWTPKDDPSAGAGSAGSGSGSGIGPGQVYIQGGSVGRRREKTKDRVERLSIVTTSGDKDIGMGSKSAPLNQALSTQQALSPREPPSGSQTALPPHHRSENYPATADSDLRTAPLSHPRARGEAEFARQQQPYYTSMAAIASRSRPSAYPDAQGGGGIPLSARQHSGDRRTFTVPTIRAPSGSSGRYEISPRDQERAGMHPPLSHHGHSGPSQSRRQNGHYPLTSSQTPSPPRLNPAPGSRREAFLQPYNQFYDLLSQTESLRFNLEGLLHRCEGAYSSQMNGMSEFKNTAAAAATLVGTLQQSAESIKEMVRYEIGRALEGRNNVVPGNEETGDDGKEKEKEQEADKEIVEIKETEKKNGEEARDKEMDELKERIQKLEGMLEKMQSNREAVTVNA